ncbi:MAG: glycosyltransferase family 2 protein [Microthrixaceae bacterium]
MAEPTPRVSVVIPCYNSLRYLPETLDAVLTGEFEDLEVVLVDDGGDDDLNGWSGRLGDPRVRVVRQPNGGVAAARNRGVADATGELIAFCDSDDVWLPHALRVMVERFDELDGQVGETPVGLVYGWYQVVLEDGTPTGRVEAHDAEGDVWEHFVTANPVGMSATLVPKSVFDELGGFDVNRDEFPIDVEDWDLWIRIAASHRVGLVRDVLYLYRRHDSNSSTAVDSLDSAYRRLLHNAFDGQSGDRLELRPAATAHVEKILGWQSLNDERDPERALAYRRSARRHDPAVMTSPDYWRLGAAARAMSMLGQNGYESIRAAAGALRRRLGLRRG